MERLLPYPHIAGEHDDRQDRVPFAQFQEHDPSVLIGQVRIEDDGTERSLPDFRQRVGARSGVFRVVALIPHEISEDLADVWVIVHDEH